MIKKCEKLKEMRGNRKIIVDKVGKTNRIDQKIILIIVNDTLKNFFQKFNNQNFFHVID